MPDLNHRERAFVAAYLGHCRGDPFKAAWRSGYRCDRDRARELLSRPHIAAAIDASLDSAALSSEEILARLADHATADLSDFGEITGDGFTLDLTKARRRGRLHCIRKIKPVRVRVIGGDDGEVATDYEIEFHDGQRALELLGRFRNLWKDGTAAVAAAPMAPHRIPDADPRFLEADQQPADVGPGGRDAAEAARDLGPGGDGEDVRDP
jgi:hypothetical protein